MSENEQLKPESWLWHLLGLINPIIVMASNIVGGFWVASGVIYMLGLGPILDVLFGRAAKPKPPRASGRPFEALLYVHAFIQFATLGTLLYRASIDGSAWTTWVAALSTGISSGVLPEQKRAFPADLGIAKPQTFKLPTI